MTKPHKMKPAFYKCPLHGRFHGGSYKPEYTAPDKMPCPVCKVAAPKSVRIADRGHVSLSNAEFNKVKQAAKERRISMSALVEKATEDIP